MFCFVKIIFINESGAHCSHLSRSCMLQLGRCCLWRTEYSISSQPRLTSCDNMIWPWGQWLQHRTTKTASVDCCYRSWYKCGADMSSLSLEAWN